MVLRSLLPSHFSSFRQLLLNTLLSKRGTVLSFLVIIPDFLHSVLVPVKMYTGTNVSATAPSVVHNVSVNLFFLKMFIKVELAFSTILVSGVQHSHSTFIDFEM